jgi:hypothetical protein
MFLGMTHFYLSLRAPQARSNLLNDKFGLLLAPRNDRLREGPSDMIEGFTLAS